MDHGLIVHLKPTVIHAVSLQDLAALDIGGNIGGNEKVNLGDITTSGSDVTTTSHSGGHHKGDGA